MNDYYVEKSNHKNKKYMVSYINEETGRVNTIHFGQAGASDMTQHKNKVRRDLYEKRHAKREDWTNPKTSGFWAYNLLWTLGSLKNAIKQTEKKYNIKIHLID